MKFLAGLLLVAPLTTFAQSYDLYYEHQAREHQREMEYRQSQADIDARYEQAQDRFDAQQAERAAERRHNELMRELNNDDYDYNYDY